MKGQSRVESLCLVPASWKNLQRLLFVRPGRPTPVLIPIFACGVCGCVCIVVGCNVGSGVVCVWVDAIPRKQPSRRQKAVYTAYPITYTVIFQDLNKRNTINFKHPTCSSLPFTFLTINSTS